MHHTTSAASQSPNTRVSATQGSRGRRGRTLPYVVLPAVLLLAACGGDDDSDASTPQATDTASSVATEAPSSATDAAASGTDAPATAAPESGTDAPTSATDDSSASSNATGDTEAAEAKAKFAPYLEEPTSIGIDTPLDGVPPTGKKVFVVTGPDPAQASILSGMKAAADLLGWSVTSLPYDPTDFATANGAFEQAVQQGADYINYSGLPYVVIQPGVEAARAANIPVFASDDVVEVLGEENWIFANPGGNTFLTKGALTMDYLIGEGAKNLLVVNIPAFPVMAEYAEGVKAEVASACTACTVEFLDAEYADLLAGEIPSLVVAYLRSHPEVDGLAYGFGGIGTGVAAAAAEAGIKLGEGGIPVVSQAQTTANLQGIIDGTENVTLANPLVFEGWVIIDAMARKSLEMDLTPNLDMTIPLWALTSSTLTSAEDDYEGPKDYAEQFKRLWNIT